MNPMRTIRRAYAAFLGAVAFGSGFIIFITPFATVTADAVAMGAVALLGAVMGLLADIYLSRSLARNPSAEVIATPQPSEALASR